MKHSLVVCLLLTIMMGLVACKSNFDLAPYGTVPKRNALPYDAFGGYISLKTVDNSWYYGEFIGTRNDSVVVLNDTVNSISSVKIASARVIVHSPNQYGAGFLVAVPNIFLGFIGGYGEGPIVFAILLTGINAMGVGIADATEKQKINYFEMSEGGLNEIMKYSRFPQGIPAFIKLSTLKPREINKVLHK